MPLIKASTATPRGSLGIQTHVRQYPYCKLAARKDVGLKRADHLMLYRSSLNLTS